MTEWQRASEGALPGDVIAGKYELVRAVGRGGMGTVFEARHAALGRSLAIKVLRPDVADDRDVIERFLREARSVAALAHPRIVDVFDVGWTDDGVVPWFAMELLEGRNLAQELKEGGEIPAVRAMSIVVQVLDALEVAHAKGIVHRDLKPENVFLVRHGIEDDVKVLDFGISKVIDKRITVTGVILGTPAYMSPEQARGARDVDHRVDLYASGAILFEMLAGRAPFEGTSYHQILLSIMTGERPPLSQLRPNLHPSLTALVERALAPLPADRWQSAADMREAIVALIDEVEQLIGQTPEWSMGSFGRTKAWAPAEPVVAAPRVKVESWPKPEREPTPSAEPLSADTSARPHVTEEAPVPPRASPEPARPPAPRPLLEGVGPARPRPEPAPRRRGILLPLLILLGLALGAGGVALLLLWPP